MDDTENNTPQEGRDNQEDLTKNVEQKKTKTTYIAIGILIIGAILIANRPAGDAVQQEEAAANDSNNQDVVVTIEDEANSPVLELTNLTDTFKVDAFDGLDKATTIINDSQGKPTAGDGAERIVSGIVPSATENMVYFATVDQDNQAEESFVGIYHYNTTSSRWQRIYKNTLESSNENAPYLRVVGRLVNQLILMQDQHGSDFGDCYSYYIEGQNEPYELFVLDLDDPYSGFETFPVPEVLKEREQERIAKCEA